MVTKEYYNIRDKAMVPHEKEKRKMNKTNLELLREYSKNQKRGMVATEMCKRAGTIKYLFKYCTPGEPDAELKFQSVIKDTISVLEKKPEQRY